MSKKSKESEMNLYYMNNGQATKKKENIEDMMKRKKVKEREKRIKQRNSMLENDDFDSETETVINMTNRNNIKKEKLKREEQIKKEKKRKKRNRKVKIIFAIITIVGIIIGIIAFALTSPIFNIKDIKVFNNELINEEMITSLSELKIGDNIFKYNTLDVVKKIKQIPYVENVKVSRKIPNTIKIEVEERTPKYSLDFLGNYAYINNQGYILEIAEDSKGLIIIKGFETEQDYIVPGNRLTENDLVKLEDVIKIINAAKENNLDSKVTYIDITDENEYIIYLEEEHKTVHLGNNTKLSDKLLNVASIIEQTKGLKGEIFVNGDLNNKFRPYFREKVEV